MNLQQELHNISTINHLELLTKKVAEGFISVMHKSAFVCVSSEFSEHKIYNSGESTKHIDWKLFARTDKLYTKRYEEETNMRCHIILDNSSSMYYPLKQPNNINNLSKIGFSAFSAAALMQLLKKQRDAIGMSVYAETYEFYAPEKGSERHHHMLLNKLESIINASPPQQQHTHTYTFLHQIAENLHRRSLVILFTDMLQTETEENKLFEALRHLTYNKHEVVLFHVLDHTTEVNFNFDNRPKRFIDLETDEYVNIFAGNVQQNYTEQIKAYLDTIRMKCLQYKIKYVTADITKDIEKILLTYLIERQKFK